MYTGTHELYSKTQQLTRLQSLTIGLLVSSILCTYTLLRGLLGCWKLQGRRQRVWKVAGKVRLPNYMITWFCRYTASLRGQLFTQEVLEAFAQGRLILQSLQKRQKRCVAYIITKEVYF